VAQTRIFVSHSHKDNEWCCAFVATLKAVGYDVWYDETGLAGGDAWVATIQREVQGRGVFIVILTPEAWASQWVQDEVQLAMATRRRILPVLLRNTQVDGFLLAMQWVTVIGEEPQVAARSVILAIEAPPAPGRAAQPPFETLDDLITLCKSLFAERRWTEALSACDRALAIDPNNIKVLRVKAQALEDVKQDGKAAAVYAQVLRLDPSDWDAFQCVCAAATNPSDLEDAFRLRVKANIDGPQWHIGRPTDAIRRLLLLGHTDSVEKLAAELPDGHYLKGDIARARYELQSQ
jgi:tetratricopeptide (TPR) repeat protein